MKHTDLALAQEIAYEQICSISSLIQEIESQDYGACSFELNNKKIIFRVAKITPTKTGQFVTFWKRIGKGPIMPFDIKDQFDLFIVSVRNKDHFGQFIFPKEVLFQKGFISKDSKGGKRAMRVYPPWDIANNKQAQKTQEWQLLYFAQIRPKLDIIKIKKLIF